MANASVSGDVIVLDVTHRQTHQAKLVPGVRFHARGDDHFPSAHFTLPLSWASCVALRGVFKQDLVVGEDLAAWAANERTTRILPSLDLRNETNLERSIDGLDDRLRPYQTVGTQFIMTAGSCIVADEMRLGKTPESIVALRELDARPSLIVTPNSVKFQWAEQFKVWWPEARVEIIRGAAGARRDSISKIAYGDADIGIINWESLRLHSRLAGYGSAVSLARCEEHGGDGSIDERKCEVHPRELNEINFVAVVADEAHRAVHPRAKQTRALWSLGWAAERRIALTGTPVLNTPEDLWALGHWISPEEFPSKTAWLERYGLVGWNPFGGLEVLGLREDTKAELFSYVDPRFIRRTRELAMPWLPEKIYTERFVELAPKQRKAYNQMKKEMLAEIDGGEIFVTNALVKLTRLRQFASAYAEITEEEGLRLAMPSCKVDAMMDIAEELDDKPAVVFAESRQLIEMAGAALEKKKYGVGYITGSIDDDERARFVAEFQRGDLQFLLVTLGAGGEGITLDRADVCVFLQRSFSLAKNSQAEDRIVGQLAGQALEIIDVTAIDTIEARVKEILEEKGQIVEEIVRDGDIFRRLTA